MSSRPAAPSSTRATSTCAASPTSWASPPRPPATTTGSGSGTALASSSRRSARRRRKLHGLANSLLLLRRYGLSLLRMDSFVQEMLQMFMPYSMDLSPGWSGLYGLTRRTLEEELVDAGFNSQTISELVTVITRINYG